MMSLLKSRRRIFVCERRRCRAIIELSLFLLILLFASNGQATENPAEVPQKAGINSRLGSSVDLGAVFTDRKGKRAPLRELLDPDRPTLIAPVYFRCPSLCTLTLNGLTEALRDIDLVIGEDFNLAAISINPNETPTEAQAKAQTYFEQLNKPEAEKQRWKFLTGSQEAINSVMSQIGFEYESDGKDYMHAALLVVLTPHGEVSHYFSGVTYKPADLRLALVEASKGRIGSAVDQILLYCFKFDPKNGRYSLIVWRVTQLFCSAVVVVLFGSLVWLRVSERKKKA